jgi:hypothetical protein
MASAMAEEGIGTLILNSGLEPTKTNKVYTTELETPEGLLLLKNSRQDQDTLNTNWVSQLISQLGARAA